MILQVAGKWRGNKAFQRFCRPSGGLGRHRGSAPVLRAPICSKDHPFRGDKSTPQWSTCKALWYWLDKRIGRPKIQLAEPEEKGRGLCPRMWHLSGFKGCPPQALWRPTVFAFTNSLMEGSLHGLCDRFTIIRGLERWQLWLDPCHCQPIDQDGVLWAS